MNIIKNLPYTDSDNDRQKLDLYIPDCEEFPVFIYFHGGGLEIGSKDIERQTSKATYLAERGIAVAVANYRLYPTAVYPEFIRDAAAAVAWVKNHINEYGKCTKFYVGGSSAGAYLSQMLCFDKKYLALYKIDPASIDGFIHDAAQPTAHYSTLRERGIDTRRVIIDDTCPLYYVGTAEEYAPMLILVATDDIKNRYEQTKLLVSTMKHFEYDMNKVDFRVLEGTHCNYPDSPLEEIICEYIKKDLA